MAQIFASYCNSYHLILCQSSQSNARTLTLVLHVCPKIFTAFQIAFLEEYWYQVLPPIRVGPNGY